MANKRKSSKRSANKSRGGNASAAWLEKKIKKILGPRLFAILFVAAAFIVAQTSKAPQSPDSKTSTITSSHQTASESSEQKSKKGNGLNNPLDNQTPNYSPFANWLSDTLSGENEGGSIWKYIFRSSESSAGNEFEIDSDDDGGSVTYSSGSVDLGSVEYTGAPYAIIDDNQPSFSSGEYTTESFENYSNLDSLGRTLTAYACLGEETMPAEEEERGNINSVKPSGWHNKKYSESVVKNKWIYNRSHLIAWCLSAENDNKQNLITGTRYFNLNMLPYETQVANYIRETGHHVLYRVTPVYAGNNLVASGVQMEAKSVEDDEVSFNVFVFNVQPGITIDYATGDNWLTESK